MPRKLTCLRHGSCVHARQEEELDYWRAKVEKQNEERDRAIDKGLMKRELDAASKQAAAARSTVEVVHGFRGYLTFCR